MIVEAQTSSINTFGSVLNPIITNIVTPIVILAFAVAVVVFVYGVLQMIFREPDAEGSKEGKKSMLWGIVGMTIMVCAWGIIYLISNTVKTF